MKFLENYQEQAYALLRITAGFMFLLHGTVKFFNFPQQYAYGELGFLTIVAGTVELSRRRTDYFGTNHQSSGIFFQWHHGRGVLDVSRYSTFLPTGQWR